MRIVPVVAISVFAMLVAWHFAMTRSKTVELVPSDYSLTYTMAWGWGMSERLDFKRRGTIWSGPSGNWIEIWKRPYNSGAILYVSNDHQTYYLGTGYVLNVFSAQQSSLWSTCDQNVIPERTSFGKLLSVSGSEPADEAIDPKAPRAPDYVEDSAEDSKTGLPVSSKYYAGLQYLGRFGVKRPKKAGRGNEIGFASSERSAEPRLGLQFSCG